MRDTVHATIDASISEAAVDVTAFLKSGQQVHVFVEHAIGSIENPMSDAQLEAKFTSLAEPIIGKEKTRQLIAALWSLGKAPDLHTILRLSIPS